MEHGVSPSCPQTLPPLTPPYKGNYILNGVRISLHTLTILKLGSYKMEWNLKSQGFGSCHLVKRDLYGMLAKGREQKLLLLVSKEKRRSYTYLPNTCFWINRKRKLERPTK